MRLQKDKIPITARYLVFAFILMYSVMPIVQRAVSTFLTTYFYMMLIALVFLLIVFGEKMNSANRYFTLLLPFIAFSALSYFSKTANLLLWGYQVLLMWLPVALGYYIIKFKKKYILGLTKIALIALLVTAVSTAIGVVQYPMAARILATTASSQDALAVLYSWRNIGGYEFVYTVVLLYPVLILAYKKKKIKPIITLMLVVLAFAIALLSEYATALLFLTISSILFFVKKDFDTRDVIIIIFASAVVLFLFYGVLSKLLVFIGDILHSDILSNRLTALAGGVSGIEATEDNRVLLYRTSFFTFLSNPIFGTFLFGKGGVGGHSFILDFLAQYGLIGASVLFFCYRRIYNCFFLQYKKEKGYGFVVWIFGEAVVLSCINTGMWLWVLAVYVPLFLYFIYGGIKNENSLDSKHSDRYIK